MSDRNSKIFGTFENYFLEEYKISILVSGSAQKALQIVQKSPDMAQPSDETYDLIRSWGPGLAPFGPSLISPIWYSRSGPDQGQSKISTRV